MKLGYYQRIITPSIGMELIGFTPPRLSTHLEKDLYVKVLTVIKDNKNYGWLVTDMLGLDLFFKKVLLKNLELAGNKYEDLQIFTTHTHSGPLCLNKGQYENEKTDKNLKDYFDYLVSQSKESLIESIVNAKEFTYRLAKSTMHDFQTNRQDPSKFSDKEILAVEVNFKNNESILVYSFGGHPTILNRESTAISPDYIGEVSELLSKKYKFNIFFNAPCGDMSTRFTRKASTIEELKRLSKIAANQVLDLSDNLGESRVLKDYSVEKLTYPLLYKEFDSVAIATDKYHNSVKKYEEAKSSNVEAKSLRLLQSKSEGYLINLMQSKENITGEYNSVNIYKVSVDDFQVINLPSEIFSSLAQPLKKDYKTWVLSLSDQYVTYLCDIDAFENQSYEALVSLYKKGEAEKMICYILKNK